MAVLTQPTFKGLNSMGELFAEFVSINRSFFVEWSFILVIPNRLAKNPPEVFLSLVTLISSCSSPFSPFEFESPGELNRSGESRGSGLVILTW